MALRLPPDRFKELLVGSNLIPATDFESALNDSFQDGEKIEAPSFTRPAEYKGMKVPEVLLSGNEKQIKDWKEEQSKLLTERWKNLNN